MQTQTLRLELEHPQPRIAATTVDDKNLHYLKHPKLWELWYIPYYGECRINIINRINFDSTALACGPENLNKPNSEHRRIQRKAFPKPEIRMNPYSRNPEIAVPKPPE